MNKILQIKRELNRNGLSEGHERVSTFLSKTGVTCLEALPVDAQEALLKKLQALEPSEDLSELLARLSAVCDYKGIAIGGPWIHLWLLHHGFKSIGDLDTPDLIDLIETIERCNPEAYTIPIKRELAEIRSFMAEIVDILQEIDPQDARIAALKAKIYSSPYNGSIRSSVR